MLDELQWLLAAQPSLASIVQRRWDGKGESLYEEPLHLLREEQGAGLRTRAAAQAARFPAGRGSRQARDLRRRLLRGVALKRRAEEEGVALIAAERLFR